MGAFKASPSVPLGTPQSGTGRRQALRAESGLGGLPSPGGFGLPVTAPPRACGDGLSPWLSADPGEDQRAQLDDRDFLRQDSRQEAEGLQVPVRLFPLGNRVQRCLPHGGSEVTEVMSGGAAQLGRESRGGPGPWACQAAGSALAPEPPAASLPAGCFCLADGSADGGTGGPVSAPEPAPAVASSRSELVPACSSRAEPPPVIAQCPPASRLPGQCRGPRE